MNFPRSPNIESGICRNVYGGGWRGDVGYAKYINGSKVLYVEKDGSITEIKVPKPGFPSLDAEAIRVIKAMPKWKPGYQRGQAVRVLLTLPITFRLK